MSQHTYDGRDVRVYYDTKRCIHAAECVKRLPSVFDPKAKPWTTPDGADADSVVQTVAACPSGALRAERLDGGDEETTSAPTRIRAVENGPLFLHGPIRFVTKAGEGVATDTRVALCRCGLSKNKPYCDNSHVDAFEAGAQIDVPAVAASSVEGNADLEIIVSPAGPLRLNGPHRWVQPDGTESEVATATALCRCGASSRKPFCDGTHNAVEFDHR